MLQAIFEALPELLARQQAMQATLDGLTARAQEPPRADGLVDADYFARVSGLSRVTILQGKAGTGEVPRASKRPALWRKADVDRFVRERAVRCASPRRKAFKLLDRGGKSDGTRKEFR